jgi:predicted dehydrogenase
MSRTNGAGNGRRLKGALVGYGFIGARGHAEAYLERSDVDIVAVVDSCAARRERVGSRLPHARIFESAEALFSSGTHLDFIDIATPPCDHAAIASAAMSRNIHVLCEKPLATSVADARALINQAAASKRVLFPCHNYRFAPVISAIAEIIASGKIGRVRSVTLDTFRPTHAKGVSEWNPDWRRLRRWSGGGIAMDHGSHSFYLAFNWLNSWPIAVTAKTVNQEPQLWDTEDDFCAVLTFPEGRLARVHLTWTAGLRAVVYSIQGERGAIVVRDDDLEVVTPAAGLNPAQAGATWNVERRTPASDWMDASHAKWFNAMFDEFVAAMENGDYVGQDVMDASRCIEVIAGSYASASDGCREISLSDAATWGPREARPNRRASGPAPVDVPLPV